MERFKKREKIFSWSLQWMSTDGINWMIGSQNDIQNDGAKSSLICFN